MENHTGQLPADLLTREEAASYLTRKGYLNAAGTLRNYAANNNAGGGPQYLRFGWRTVRYRRKDLDDWVLLRSVKVGQPDRPEVSQTSQGAHRALCRSPVKAGHRNHLSRRRLLDAPCRAWIRGWPPCYHPRCRRRLPRYRDLKQRSKCFGACVRARSAGAAFAAFAVMFGAPAWRPPVFGWPLQAVSRVLGSYTGSFSPDPVTDLDTGNTPTLNGETEFLRDRPLMGGNSRGNGGETALGLRLRIGQTKAGKRRHECRDEVALSVRWRSEPGPASLGWHSS